jgi:hypothetical protein
LTSLDVKLMTKDQYLGFQQGPRPEQSDQRQPDQAASFSHQAEALRDSASVASRIRFPTGTVLIRRMSVETPLWGAPRIHGELLKLGFEVAQSSVAKYMVKRRGPPSQGWRTFLRNHAPDIAAMDLFVVPTIGFDLLYALRPVCTENLSELMT